MTNIKKRGTKESRRGFLKTVAAAGVATAAGSIAAPNVSRAQTITWRFQSTWPQKDIFHEFAQDYAKRVNDMAGGRLKLDVLAAGAVVGAFQMQDAVHAGALDGGHGVCAYWYGKNKAFSLFGTAPPYFGDAHQLLGWFYYGGGEALYQELVNNLKINTVGFLNFPMPTQPLGWFKKEIKSADDLKNLKWRTVGLAADLMKEFGAAVTILPGGEIVPALDRGLIDGAEFNNPSSDRALGFPDVSKIYMIQSYHQKVECFEVIFNKAKYDPLPAELKAILRYASEAASSDGFWKAQDRYTKDLEGMRRQQGVKTYRTPRSVLDAQLVAWDKLIGDLSADPFFKKVIESQKAWGRRVGGFFLEYEAPASVAFNHFYAKKT